MENNNTQADKSSSLERNELHNTIWKVANELRGSVDGWDFKQYVLGILFYRYISENMTHYINKQERELNPNFDYALLSDEEAEGAKEGLIEEKGFFIPPSALFCNVLKNAHHNEDLNVTLQNIFNGIEKSSLGFKSEENVKGLFADLDVNSNKLGSSHKNRVEKLTKILEAIGGMQLGDYQKSGIDVFGDAYEYLMTMYASNAGKSGGEFFTPQEVSELLAKITLTERKTIKHFSALASMEKIKENDYNLSVNRYVEQEDTKEAIDIKALNGEISQIVERQSALRNSLESIIKELEEGQNA
ncbi:type I restriction-modification system subunit M [Helicobacter pylori]|nr:type I restriction-modification system subunit M [Helicobacter pylori]